MRASGRLAELPMSSLPRPPMPTMPMLILSLAPTTRPRDNAALAAINVLRDEVDILVSWASGGADHRLLWSVTLGDSITGMQGMGRRDSLVLLSIPFFARRDDFHAAQPEGRKIVAQCASTGRKTVPPPPRDGAEEPTRRSLLTPRSGAGKRARRLPTAVRRGLLSFALRALRTLSCLRLAAMRGSLASCGRVANPPQVSNLPPQPSSRCVSPIR